jgi:hypothetical protein
MDTFYHSLHLMGTSWQEEEDAPQQESPKEDKLMLRSQGVWYPKLCRIISGGSNYPPPNMNNTTIGPNYL